MNKFFTTESVTEGHPDKMCDLISDNILDEYLKKDKNSKVGIETFASKNLIVIAGQVSSITKVEIEPIVRNVIKQIGYDNEKIDLDYRTCKIIENINKQSPDISIGIKQGGAGDQGIIFGYACDESKNYMPFAVNIAHELAKKLTQVRKNKEVKGLRPDGKIEVTVEYENEKIKRIDTILISTQHEQYVDIGNLKNQICEKVINKIVPLNKIDDKTKILINPTGKFVIGGPLADTGLTGRKIIVDTYGGYAHSGGGAFSGKDPSKVDRSAAYMLRHIAKNIIANGYAKKCEIQISYAIGIEKPVSLWIDTFATNTIPENEILKKVEEKFDLTPNGIIKYLNLQTPIYSRTTNYGHFGREIFEWENIIKL